MEMAVRNLEASDDERDSLALQNLFLGACNSFGYGKAMLRNVVGKVGPLIHFNARNHQQVTTRNRVNCHECDAHLVGVHKCSRQFACNDSRKY